MSKIQESLSIVVETGTRSTLETIEEIELNDDQSLEEFRKLEAKVKVDTNRFCILCDNARHCMSQVDNSMFELLELKDKLLLQFLPLNVTLHIAFVLSRFFRVYSESKVPINELIRLTQLYSEQFDMKSILLRRLYESNDIKKRLLKHSFQKLTSFDAQTKKYEEQKSINNWEKMYIRLALKRANVRKWKFRIKTFREQAGFGYEHVIQWLYEEVPRASSSAEITSMKQLFEDENPIQLDTTFEVVTVLKENKQKSIATFEKDEEGIRFNNNESFLVSSIIEESKLIEQNPIVLKVDAETQVQPDFDNQQTSTDDILSSKALLMCIYRPIGIAYSKFQCMVHTQGRVYKTNIFIANKSKVSKIDRKQVDELLIPMPNSFKRRSLFYTDMDPDSIKIDVVGDDTFCGTLTISSEDLYMLDLPKLYNSTASSLIGIDDNISTLSSLTLHYDLDDISSNIYQSWISRTPQLFSIYNNQHESIGKLPITMFWYNKTEQTHMTKSTMTMPIDIDESIPKMTPSQDSEINESIALSIVTKTTDENIQSTSIETTDDSFEPLRTTYETEIIRIHETYQMEIGRLTDIINGILSQQASQTIENTQEELFYAPIGQENATCETIIDERPGSPISSKKFLDRYQIYLQRSITNRRQLIKKIEQETSLANERQMEIQHRLYKPKEANEYNDDLSLPAVFMPFRSGNVFNPRAYHFFHPIGSTNPRLTQAPTVLKLPPLPSGSVSVLNLFELSQSYGNTNAKDHIFEKKT